MAEDARVAFCPIFFGSQGGTFDQLGLPIFKKIDYTKKGARGLCDHPFDCLTCPLMSQWLVARTTEGWFIGWECDLCLRETEDPSVRRVLPGYYQAGRESDPEQDPNIRSRDDAVIPGCTRCGWETSFLQLVLRRRV